MSFLKRWFQRKREDHWGRGRNSSAWDVEATGDLLALMRAGQDRRGVNLNEPLDQ